MPYIPPEVVEKAREMDLLTYLKSYEPQELVHFGGNTYCTRTHDSLKISNGKWCWFSRGIGGYSALDYLIKVKEIPFTEAVEAIMGNAAVSPPVYEPAPKQEKPKVLLLPKANRCATHAAEYLHRRGIDYDLIDFCISSGRLYESAPYYNVVFVGMDSSGKARYANQRGIGSDFIGDANGSDKHYSFGIPAVTESDTLHLFESAVDLLSYGTLLKLHVREWRKENLLSLAGVYKPKKIWTKVRCPPLLCGIWTNTRISERWFYGWITTLRVNLPLKQSKPCCRKNMRLRLRFGSPRRARIITTVCVCGSDFSARTNERSRDYGR